MDPSQLKKIVIPAAAVAAIILVVGSLFLLGEPGSNGSAGKPGPEATGTPDVTPPGANSDGMSATLPPVDSPEFKTVAGGLKIWDVKIGEGEECKPGAFVSMHYIGWRLDGFIFDSSVRKGDPLKMSLGQLIRGWQQGVPGMKPGGIRRLYIPSALAYGPSGQGKDIPPNADLVFEVKLLGSR
jgi:hypothetical protein